MKKLNPIVIKVTPAWYNIFDRNEYNMYGLTYKILTQKSYIKLIDLKGRVHEKMFILLSYTTNGFESIDKEME